VTDWGTPARYEPPCPCGAPIALRGLAGAKCSAGHVARLSLGPEARLEWPLPGAWRYQRPPAAPTTAEQREAAIEAHCHCRRCGAPLHRGRTLDGVEHVCQRPVRATREVVLL